MCLKNVRACVRAADAAVAVLMCIMSQVHLKCSLGNCAAAADISPYCDFLNAVCVQ